MKSKLPNTGTTIFTVMSQMAQDYGAVNLSQGFPDFEVSPELMNLVHQAMKQGHNQYAPMPGLPQLREVIGWKLNEAYGCNLADQEEITVTGGATEALYCAITALIHPGDEVIIFEPAYDSYEPVIELNGGIVRRVKMQYPDFAIPWDEVRSIINSRTKLIIINSPHNPTGSVLDTSDLENLSQIVEDSEAFVLSDEVYEHIVFDKKEHQSVLRDSSLRERSMVVFSFGKTFHATGWKVGYMIASKALTKELRKIHQFLNFSVNTPIQHALSHFLSQEKNYREIPNFYQEKRDLFLGMIKGSKFEGIPSGGTYFQLLSYRQVDDGLGDMDMAEKLTKESGLASIPVSVFYHDRHDDKILRFCFAKKNDTLEKAAEILCKI